MSTARGRGRPRSVSADAAILRTTLELLVEEGLQGLALERVAARAGVAKTTLYRRYNGRDELVAAALGTLGLGAQPLPDTGSLRSDMADLVQRRIAAARTTTWNLLMPRLVVDSARDPQLSELIHRTLIQPERARMAAILRRAAGRGELAADLDIEFAIDLLVGPLVYRILISGGELAGLEQLLMRLVDVLAAVS